LVSALAILTLGLTSIGANAASQVDRSFTSGESKELNSISSDALSPNKEIKESARNKTKTFFNKVGGVSGVNSLIDRVNKDSTLFGVLSKDERKAVVAFNFVFDTITTDSTDSGLSSQRGSGNVDRNYGCTTLTSSKIGTNSLGNWIWRYFQQTYYCYNGSNLTTAYRQNRWGEVYVPLWQFTGHIGNWERGGAYQWEFVDWTQGNFQLCLAGWGIGCVQYAYPWVEQHVYGNGGYSTTTGG
jgi:hypothetical protein